MKASITDINSVLQILVPKDNKIFPLFIKSAENLTTMANSLQEGLAGGDVTRLTMMEEIKRFEEQGDEYTHAIVGEAQSNFLVPFDREDIYDLAIALDDVADFMNGTAKRIYLYKPLSIHPAMVKIAGYIVEQCHNLCLLTKELSELKYTLSCQKYIANIRNAEKNAKEMRDSVYVELFAEDTDVIEKIKMREIIGMLTRAADSAEEAASVFEQILVKVS